MSDTTLIPLPSGIEIDKAAKAALPLFRLNMWTWRGSPTPPDEADLGAMFSSLAWELDSKYAGTEGTHFAACGRLMVVRNEYSGSVNFIYSVTV